MQRPVGLCRVTEENCIINITLHSPQAKYSSPRRSVDDKGGGLLINNDVQSGIIHHHRRKSRFLMSENWVFVVPLTILMLCLLVFWLFPFPVKLVIKDGRIIALHKSGMPLPLDIRRFL